MFPASDEERAPRDVKVLILAYDFPPYVSVGGLRPYAWLEYLRRYGVEPVVVTRQWARRYGDERDYVAPGDSDRVEIERSEHGTLIRTPYTPNLANRLLLSRGPDRWRRLRRLVTAWYEVMQYHAFVGPKAEVYRAARRYLEESGAEAIVATGEPFVLFHYAAALSREFGIPWVADYRDPWSQNRKRNALVPGRDEARLERRVVASAAAITTPAEVFRDLLARLHPDKRIEVIPNGYDPEAIAAAAGVEQGRDRLTVAFTGTVYPWYPLTSAFGVFEDFVRDHPEAPLAVRMIGVSPRESLEKLVRGRFPNLAPAVTFTPRLSNRDVIRELAAANVFLTFNNYANPGTKIYDYLALGRRILLCYSDDPDAQLLEERHYAVETVGEASPRVLEELVRETAAGVVVRDAKHLREVMEELAAEFRGTGSISCTTTGAERYSRVIQTERLAELLRSLQG